MKTLVAALFLCSAFHVSAGLPDKRLLNIPNPLANRQEHDNFGASMVSTTEWLAVSMPRSEPTYYSQERGEVKVFRIDSQPTGTLGTLQKTYSNPNLTGGSQFGAAMALHGHSLLVGAQDNAEDYIGLLGRAYLYDLTAAGTSVQIVYPSPINEGFERFGRAVAISSTRVAISGLGINTAAGATGIVHVYDRTSATPTVPIFSLPNPSPATGESFGLALLIQGSRLVVSDPGENEGKGQVWIYDLSSATPTVPTLIIPSPMVAAENEHFGHCLAMDGDRLVVGAPEGFGLNGRAYVFDLASATPAIPIHSYQNPEPFIWEAFGSSVAIRGTQVAIGCLSDYSDFGFTGCVYPYDLAGTTPGEPQRKITSPVPYSYNEAFSYSLTFGISKDDLIVGAPGNDRIAPDAGDAYRLGLNGAAAPTFHGSFQKVTPADIYGALADMDGDRMVSVAGGWLHVYDLASGTPTAPYLSMVSPDPHSGDKLGGSVAMHGTLVAVSVLNDTLPAPQTHKVHVYDLSLGYHAPVATFGPADTLGTSVDVQGTKIVIGCPGGAYVDVYDLASATPGVSVYHLQSVHGNLGKSVSISGSLIAASNGSNHVVVYDLDSATPTVPWYDLNYLGTSVSLSGRKLLVGTGTSAALFDLDAMVSGAPSVTFANPNPADYTFGELVSLSGSRAFVTARYSGSWSANKNILAYGYDISSPAPNTPLTVLTQDLAYGQGQRGTLSQSEERVITHVPFEQPDVYASGSLNLYVTSQPEISVERPEGVVITSPHTFPLGYVGQSGFYHEPTTPVSVPLVLTVRNLGGDPLHLSGVSKSGLWADAVHLMPSSSLPITIPAGGSQTFTAATFENSTMLGSIDATVRLHSNDGDESVMQINFQGTAVTPDQAWRQLHFGTLLNQGTAADAADPDGDGQSNYDEFMAGTSPVDSTSRLRVEIEDHPTIPGQKNIQIVPFLYGRTFTLQANDDLSPTGWQNLWTGTATAPELMPRPDAGAVGKSKRFYRVSATRFNY